jgi:cation diffusion facilitator family transporter
MQTAVKASTPDGRADGIIRKVTLTGMLVNVLLAGIKFVAGILGNSQALLADAVHSLSDCGTDLAVIGGSFFWNRPPDSSHPHGHQRIETVVTLLIGFVLLSAGMGVGWHAVVTTQHQQGLQPGAIALAAAAASLLVKEVLYRWTAAVGKRVRSSALAANAWHHRLDALSSIPVFLAVGGAMLFPKLRYLDNIGAIIVSVFIIQAALKIMWPSLSELLEKGADAKTVAKIEKLVMDDPRVIQIHRLRTRYLGASLRLDFHMVVSGALSVKQGHDIAEAVKDRIMATINDVADVIIHIEPEDAAID